MSRDKNLQEFWRFLYHVTQPLPTIRHFENRRGEGPGDEVASKVVARAGVTQRSPSPREDGERCVTPARAAAKETTSKAVRIER